LSPTLSGEGGRKRLRTTTDCAAAEPANKAAYVEERIVIGERLGSEMRNGVELRMELEAAEECGEVRLCLAFYKIIGNELMLELCHFEHSFL
jgi:hypothetical protein